MRFEYGHTRFVFLVGPYAIKVARIRPLRPFIRLFQVFKTGNVEEELKKYDKKATRGGIKYLLAGVVANRTEYRLYKKFQSEHLAPTLYMFLWGAVNVQMRGSRLRGTKKLAVKQHPLWVEGNRSLKEFCLIGDKVCLADYGRAPLESVLSELSPVAQ